MCGIAGVFNIDHRAVTLSVLSRMAEVLRHRGPDGQGFVLLDSQAERPKRFESREAVAREPDGLGCDLGFAHRRLAIIDLSATGAQPMTNEDETLWLVYNGEIYNHVELRDELAQRGHRFRGRSDSEVLLRAYEEWGPECVTHFNGMWAFALWDARRRQLFCSRDRFGVKPFYYFFDGGRFIFASEIKGILASGQVRPQVNDRAVYSYLHAGYGYLDLTDETFFEGIKKLPASSNLILRGGGLHVVRYWELAERQPQKESLSIAFYNLFEDTVRLRLRSDVRVGGALSGGLDSSSIACVAVRLLGPENYETFSVCYDDERYDEREFILPVVHKTGVKHHLVFPQPTDFLATVVKILWHQEEPFPDLNIYSQWWMYSEVKRHGVKVFLNGHGGDEVLGGYAHHHLAFLVDLLRDGRLGRFVGELKHYAGNHGVSLPRSLWQVLHRCSSVLTPGAIKRSAKRILGTGAPYLDREFALRYREGTDAWTPPRSGLLKHDMRQNIWSAPLPAWLHLEDRNSMAFSIESRTPFLDYRLVEFLVSIPYEMQFHKGMSKHILRDAMRGLLPEEVRCRTDKRGFQSAGEHWFRSDLKGVVREILTSTSFKQRGYLDLEKVFDAFERHCRGEVNLRFGIWSWVCLELWFRSFIDREEWAIVALRG